MITGKSREHADIYPQSHSVPMKQVWIGPGVLERGFAAYRQDAPLNIIHRRSVMYVDRRRAVWKHHRKRGKPCDSDKFQ
jgi:hypothetical protein